MKLAFMLHLRLLKLYQIEFDARALQTVFYVPTLE
jgi:hypothetical protein